MMDKIKLFILIIYLAPNFADSQGTYSITYAKPETFGILPFDMIQLDNHVFICVAELLYYPDDESFEYNHKILKYDPQGNLIQTRRVPAYINRIAGVNNLDKNLAVVNDSSFIYLTETPERDGTSIYLIDFDLNKSYMGTFCSKNPEEGSYLREHRGAYIADGSIYLYSFVHNPAWGSVNRRGQILRIDMESKEIIWENIITPQFNARDIVNFHSYLDSNFIFQVNYWNGLFGPSSIYNSNFYVIDQYGNIKEVIDFSILVRENEWDSKPRFITDDFGHIFFSHSRNLHTNFTKYNYNVNKVDPSNGRVLWAFTPPNNVIALRIQMVYEMQKTKNGNFLIAGTTTDRTDDHFNVSVNIQNGFILKLDPRGEILWYRLFKHPNHSFQPKEEYGWFKSSLFHRVTELDDGRIAVLGYKILNWDQADIVDPLQDITTEMWLLVLDENGCFDGQKCQSIIRIDYPEFIEPPAFSIGTKWTYDYSPPPDNPNHTIYSYINYEVTDSFTRNDTLIYLIENNRGLPDEWIIQNEYKVWFWDEFINDWQLTYDFRAFVDYSSHYRQENNAVEIKYKIDTIDQGTYFGERDLEKVQVGTFVYQDNTISDQLRILDGLGRMTGGLRLPFYGTPNGDNPKIGDIRCFEQGDFFFNFKPIFNQIKCDSVWIDTGTSVQDIDKENNLVIYPNPSSGDFYLYQATENLFYQIIDNKGKLVDEGRVVNSTIPQQTAGHYLFKLWRDGSKQTFQLISIKE